MSGVLLHAAYLGGVWWAVRHGVPASISALIAAAQPIATALLAPALLARAQFARTARRRRTGTARPHPRPLAETRDRFVRRRRHRADCGQRARHVRRDGRLFLPETLSPFRRSARRRRPGNMSARSPRLCLSLSSSNRCGSGRNFNDGVGPQHRSVTASLSIGAIGLLLLLIRHGEVSRAAQLIYLVPPTAAIQAYFLFGERLSALQLLGMAATAAGVMIAFRR